jgi:hypothetical protein
MNRDMHEAHPVSRCWVFQSIFQEERCTGQVLIEKDFASVKSLGFPSTLHTLTLMNRFMRLEMFARFSSSSLELRHLLR